MEVVGDGCVVIVVECGVGVDCDDLVVFVEIVD